MDLSVDLGVRLRNPAILASGILGMSLETLKRVYESGAGAVVSKSVGLEPNPGYENPTVVEVDCGYLNAIGLANPGVDSFSEELAKVDIPLFVSLYSRSAEGFRELVRRLDGFEVLGFELNLSCPHVKGVGLEVGSDPDAVYEIVRGCKRETAKPIFVKLSPMVRVVEVAESCKRAGADAVVLANTFRGMAIDVESMKPILSNRFGGLSGPAVRPMVLALVYEVYEKVKIPIIASGGVVKWEDMVEYILAGARAVEIGTGIAYRGLGIFKELLSGLEEYMRRKGFERVEELVGLAHE